MKPKKKSKRNCLTNAQAIERLHVIFEKVRRDYSHALHVECSMESANQVVSALVSTESSSASAYNTALDSMKFDLSVSLARLLDNSGIRRKKNGRSPNQKDIASVPFLIRLLRQKRCKDFFVKMNPEVEKSIKATLIAYSNRLCSPSAKQARRKLKSFRNHELAHSLIFESNLRNPKFNEIFGLTAALGEVIANLSLVIDDAEWDIHSEKEALLEEAKIFWSKAFSSQSDDL